MNEEERLIDGYKRLSRRSQYIVLAQIVACAEMEETARRIATGGLVKDLSYIMPANSPVMEGANE